MTGGHDAGLKFRNRALEELKDGGRKRLNAIGKLLARQGILIAFVIFMIGFALLNDRFLAVDNVLGVIRSSAILGVMALGVTFVVNQREPGSFGWLDECRSRPSLCWICMTKIGPDWPFRPCSPMTMALGGFIGVLVGYFKLKSLIVTLGMCRRSMDLP